MALPTNVTSELRTGNRSKTTGALACFGSILISMR